MNKQRMIEEIEKYRGKLVRFKYNGSRNQIEEFYGTIENTYNSIFTIKIKDSNSIKSFSYNDVINKTLQIFI